MKKSIAALLLIVASVGSFLGLFCIMTGKIQDGSMVWICISLPMLLLLVCGHYA